MKRITETGLADGNTQLPLDIKLNDSSRFDNFHGGPNQELKQVLRRCADGSEREAVFFWGKSGSGKTHLLQAACREAGERGHAAAYLPLHRNAEIPVRILDGFENLSLVCMDDIQAVAGLPEWEEAIFHLFNRLRERQLPFVATADCPPSGLALQLTDLVSRLGWGLVYPMQPLDDQARLELLQLRARGRGLELPEETGRFLLSRYPRDLPALCALLDRLDHASLAAQRRLTIPFVKTVLAGL